MIWFLFIATCILYLGVASYFLFRKKQNKIESISSNNIEVAKDEKINIIAMPRNYIINVVQSEKEVDTTKYTDIVVNISDLVKKLNEKDSPQEIELVKVFFKDVKMNEFKKLFK